MYYNFHAAKANVYRAIVICVCLALVASFFGNQTQSASAGNKRIVAASETTTTVIPVNTEMTLVAEAATTNAVQVTIENYTTTSTIPNPCQYDNTHRYKILSGDALYSIADKYNVGIYDIVGCNQWQEGLDHLILVNDEIILPPEAYLTIVTTTTVAPSTTIKLPSVTPITVPVVAPTVPPGTRVTHPFCWWEPLIRQAFANAGASINVQDFFVYVAWRESKCTQIAHNNNAATKDDSYGLFQINMLPKALGPLMTSWGYTGSMLLDGDIAIEAAVRLWQKCGQGPWVKPYSCSYN